MYYKEAVGAMIVFDVTREKTFQAVTKWKADIDENLSVDGLSIPVVLLANKVITPTNDINLHPTILHCPHIEYLSIHT